MKFVIAIPARYGSQRMPGKPLLKLGDKCLIQRCYESAKKTELDVMVLTDDKRIASVIGQDAHIISGNYRNGTERIAAATEQGLFDDYQYIINVQGDQPYIDPKWIEDIVNLFNNDQNCNIVHVYSDLQGDEIADESVPKMVHFNDTLNWISRKFNYGSRFIGIYGFTKTFLLQHNKLPVKEGEAAENCEQLRWIENGYQVKVMKVNIPKNFVDINTPKDVEKWKAYSGNLRTESALQAG
jgi:3-deoxy-manno-octulosonate cytidylyltransferase (CMP-KDO synthetase)